MQEFILGFFVGGNALLSLLIFRNNPRSWTNRLFTILIGLLTVYLVANTQLYSFEDVNIRFALTRFIIAWGAFINLGVFLFLLTFPKQQFPLKQKYSLSLLAITLVFFVAGFTKFIFADIRIVDSIVVPSPGMLMPLYLIHTVGLIGGGILAIFLRFRKSMGLERVRIQFVLLSFSILFFFIIVFNFVLTVFFQYGNFVPFLPVYILIFNVLITYSIIRHRLLDLRLIVARTVLYSILVFIVAVISSLIFFVASSFLPYTLSPLQLTVSIAVLTALSFNLWRSLIQHVTDNYLFKGQYDTEDVLSELTHIMAFEIVTNVMSEELLRTLQQRMRISKAGFLFIEEGGTTSFIGRGFENNEAIVAAHLEKTIQNYPDEWSIVEYSEDEELKKILVSLEVNALFVLKVKEQTIGLLLLGPKASGDIYSNQDIELLEIFAPQAAVALNNAESYRRIKDFNVTLEKKVAERTQELKQTQERELSKAKELLRLKDEFVFIATHDLGTPVTSIRGFASLLAEKKDSYDEDTRENIVAIQDSVNRLSQLTNDLLQVARSDAGTIKISAQEIDVIAMLETVLKEVKTRADERKISLVKTFHAPKYIILNDKEKLAEVMENLLSNAVKYNKDGGQVTISTQVNADKIKIMVADTGYGIPAAKQDKIFEKFFRAQQEQTLDVPGTGLGLFVVKMLVSKMGGTISFVSKENEGTTFTVELPVKVTSTPSTEQSASE